MFPYMPWFFYPSLTDGHLDCFLLWVVFVCFNYLTFLLWWIYSYNHLCEITGWKISTFLRLLMFIAKNLTDIASYLSTGGQRKRHFPTLSPTFDIISLHIVAKLMGKKITSAFCFNADSFWFDYFAYLWEWISFLFFIKLFIFGRVGSSLLRVGFL